jgi:hypothetical protein
MSGSGPQGTAFDRAWLPPQAGELVVLGDTHSLLHLEFQGGEWEPGRASPARAGRALGGREAPAQAGSRIRLPSALARMASGSIRSGW